MFSINSLLTADKLPAFQDFSEGWAIQTPVEQISTQPLPEQEASVAEVATQILNKDEENAPKIHPSTVKRDRLLKELREKMTNDLSELLKKFIKAVKNNDAPTAFDLVTQCQAAQYMDPHSQLVFYFHYVTFLLKNNFQQSAIDHADEFLKLEKTPSFSKEITSAPDYQKIKVAFLTQYVKVLMTNNNLGEAEKIASLALSMENNDSCKGELYFYLSSIAAQKEQYDHALSFITLGANFTYDLEIMSKYFLQRATILNKMRISPEETLKICKAGLQFPNITESIKGQILREQGYALYKADGVVAVEKIKQLMHTTGIGADGSFTLNIGRLLYNKDAQFYKAIMTLNPKCFLVYRDEEIALKLWLYKCCAHFSLAEQANTPEIKAKHFVAAKYYFAYSMTKHPHNYEKIKREVSEELNALAILTKLYEEYSSAPLVMNAIPLANNEVTFPTNEVASNESGKDESSSLNSNEEQPLNNKRKRNEKT